MSCLPAAAAAGTAAMRMIDIWVGTCATTATTQCGVKKKPKQKHFEPDQNWSSKLSVNDFQTAKACVLNFWIYWKGKYICYNFVRIEVTSSKCWILFFFFLHFISFLERPLFSAVDESFERPFVFILRRTSPSSSNAKLHTLHTSLQHHKWCPCTWPQPTCVCPQCAAVCCCVKDGDVNNFENNGLSIPAEEFQTLEPKKKANTLLACVHAHVFQRS